MTFANYAAIHPRRRGIYVSIAWRRSKVNTLLKRRQLSRRVKMTKSQKGQLNRMYIDGEKSLYNYFKFLKLANRRLCKKWENKRIKKSRKFWKLFKKWSKHND